jgi:hypothetical protein
MLFALTTRKVVIEEHELCEWFQLIQSESNLALGKSKMNQEDILVLNN